MSTALSELTGIGGREEGPSALFIMAVFLSWPLSDSEEISSRSSLLLSYKPSSFQDCILCVCVLKRGKDIEILE